MNISFIGLGNMGAAMARNLLGAGHQLTVFNRSREKAEAFGRVGATIASSPYEACRSADAVMSMLADDEALEQLTFGEHGIISGLRRGAVHISHSTISIAMARRLTAEHQRQGQTLVSAPVFGRPEAAENKKLVIVTGGAPETINSHQALFDAIGRRTFHAGVEPWHANAVKLGGNFMILSLIETFGESFALMRKSGLDPHLFLEVITEVFGSPVYSSYGSKIVTENFSEVGFALKHGFKDLRLILQLSGEVAAPMPLASIMRDHFLSALAHGEAEVDTAALARVSSRMAGL